MIELSMSKPEEWDEEKQVFVIHEPVTYKFEHSLVALANWEIKHRKPFLTSTRKTTDELLDYYQCMAIGSVPDRELFTVDDANKLNAYISDTPTATVIRPRDGETSSSYMTSETIYAMMAMSGVPFECDKWNLNRLVMVLGVISERNKPQAKMSKSETIETYRSLNDQRRREMNSKG